MRHGLGTTPTAAALYQHLLQLHGDAFDAQRFEMAYHLLAAALHLAEEFGDPELVGELEVLAGKRQGSIDKIQPEHRISSASARLRGTLPVFTSLAHTAAAARVRTRADATLQRHRRKS